MNDVQSYTLQELKKNEELKKLQVEVAKAVINESPFPSKRPKMLKNKSRLIDVSSQMLSPLSKTQKYS